MDLTSKLSVVEQHYEELNEKLCRPEVIADQAAYRALMKERSSLEPTVSTYRTYKEVQANLKEARDLLQDSPDPEMKAYLEEEVATLSPRLDQLEEKLLTLLLPKDPLDEKNTIMEIRAGTGGEEASLFAADLYRMYSHLAERKGWKTEIMSSSPTELGGFKEIIFSIQGERVYSYLKYERGVHRVQRVPATEAGGRIHTSTATVAVLAEAEDFDVQISHTDLTIDTYRASGAGGQHVNKTDSAVRITHLPTGVVVACQDERSQHQNKEKAMRILRARIYEIKQIEQEQEIAAQRKSQVGSGERSEKIRTYNFPDNRVTDHRTRQTVKNLPEVLEGDLDDILETLIAEEQKARLQAAG
ncbi:MAG: peptide chain release factor 1 [Armatimonadetes bacterium]|nr:peptide chain release factor 1 [Armatimonadota bacterium]